MKTIISKRFSKTDTTSENRLATMEVTLDALYALRDKLISNDEFGTREEDVKLMLIEAEITNLLCKIFVMKNR
jgi:hypothetical protein